MSQASLLEAQTAAKVAHLESLALREALNAREASLRAAQLENRLLQLRLEAQQQGVFLAAADAAVHGLLWDSDSEGRRLQQRNKPAGRPGTPPSEPPPPSPPLSPPPPSPPPASPGLCFNTCTHHLNEAGKCNEAAPGATVPVNRVQVCEHGTDCDDCGVRDYVLAPAACMLPMLNLEPLFEMLGCPHSLAGRCAGSFS